MNTSNSAKITDIRHRLFAFAAAVKNYVKTEPYECLGAILGGVGALVLSQNASYSKWGWVSFAASNLFLLAMAKKKRLHGVLVLQAYFCYTSFNGIANHFFSN